MRAFALCLLSLVFGLNLNAEQKKASALRLNHIQMKGTHNSFHVSNSLLSWTPLGYDHAPLEEQLSLQGVRQFEFDLHQCGRKDFCVYHIGLIDSGSTCETLRICLSQIRNWSQDNPKHHPIFIFLELKDDESASRDPGYFDQLEMQIAEIFPRDKLLIPDDVRGSYSTLKEAVLNEGWPKINDVRGEVVFVLLNESDHRDHYALNHPSLEQRLMFTTSSIDRDDAAIIKLDDPLKNMNSIRDLAKMNLIIRTRADADLSEAKNNDYTRFNAALLSGAHMISTDFPVKLSSYDYWISLPEGTPSRCNLVTALHDCKSDLIENALR